MPIDDAALMTPHHSNRSASPTTSLSSHYNSSSGESSGESSSGVESSTGESSTGSGGGGSSRRRRTNSRSRKNANRRQFSELQRESTRSTPTSQFASCSSVAATSTLQKFRPVLSPASATSTRSSSSTLSDIAGLLNLEKAMVRLIIEPHIYSSDCTGVALRCHCVVMRAPRACTCCFCFPAVFLRSF